MSIIYIKNGSGTEILNLAFVHRFCVVNKKDCTLLIASYGITVPPVTVARYKTREEAVKALESLYNAISSGAVSYTLPANTSEVDPVKVAERRKAMAEHYGSRVQENPAPKTRRDDDKEGNWF